jgi:hypothetical protein
MVVRSKIYYPEHILAYGSRNAHSPPVVGFGSFLDRLVGGRERWRSKHRIEAGSEVWGWSPSLDEGLDPSQE